MDRVAILISTALLLCAATPA
jgi:hypothetical protein